MEWLNLVDSRKLLRFFRGNQTELSRVENSDLFLGKLRDCELIPQHKYEEVRRTRKEARRNKAMYELLEWFVKETPENIKLFWRCVFQQPLLEQCPTLRRLHGRLSSAKLSLVSVSELLWNLRHQVFCHFCSTMKTRGPSTRSVYLSLAFVSLLLHLLLALFCLSVLQTACVPCAPPSLPSSAKDCPRQWSPKEPADRRCEDSLGGPRFPAQEEDRRHDSAAEARKLMSAEEVGAVAKGGSKLEALFQHPLYNLPLPELQEDDWLMRLKSEEEDSSEEEDDTNERTASSEEQGYYKLDWTSDVNTHPPWLRFHLNINRWRLYDRSDANIAQLSHHLATERIIGAVQMSGGTQLKLILSFPNRGRALLKPMKQTRETETDSNLFYFSDFERHNAEISAFHLDRVLGFNRIPPVIGRLINVTADVREITTDRTLAKTFFSSPAGNVCFYGSCDYYCSTEHPVCGRPHALEVSVAVMLPDTKIAPRRSWRSPWKRSYSRSKIATWETDPDYCDQVKQTPPYNSGTRLVDLMDMVILDFLMSNMDRHHYETFESFGNETFLLHLDNGRAFGRHSRDEPSILAPLQQCCRIRQSTLLRLKLLAHPTFHLSDVMRESLAQDPLTAIAPLLTEPHLSALDRRLATVLQVVKTCQEHHQDVTFDDLDSDTKGKENNDRS
ncbi:extracellular serine/threonine protein kinase FAM20C [Synchiropus splendidus]|uniref:extracellular serine/threonine protein kinase FAM20C n=1 Tax=Synchiropus splendidus TaxID=270530 RepID=UPI00237DA307|nr:extracellular serine/threonine protein kinase FAM20C [Synchiropus splendidus]